MKRRTERHLVFVLKRVVFQESDLMLTLLSEQGGRLSARARGARASQKRFGGRLSLFRKLDALLEIDERYDVANLKEVTVVRDFSDLETSFEKIAFASYATDLVRAVLYESDAARGPSRLLEDVYQDLSDAPDDVHVMELRLDRFIYELLAWWGSAPIVSGCLRCGLSASKMQKYRFLRSGEGLVCGDCRRPSDAVGIVAPEAFYILNFVAGLQPSVPELLAERPALKQVRRVLQASVKHVVSRDLKSYTILEPLLNQN